MSAKTIYSNQYRRLVQSLRTLRENAGITQSGLSLQLGWPQQRLSAVEAGVRRLDVMEFLHLIGALGLSPEEGIRLAANRAGSTSESPKRRKSAK
ncbi:MAG: helix-turn-helix domain-containing protein [Luteimonas sp.]